MTCIKVRSDKSVTYYINNGYSNVTKVYEEYIVLGTDKNHKKRKRQKKTSFPKE